VPRREHRVILGEMIRNYREKADLTQEELAEKSDLSPKYMGEVERASVNISLDALARVARALKVRITDLLGGT